MGSEGFCYENIWSSGGTLTKTLQGCSYSLVNFKLSTVGNKGEKLLLASIVLGMLSITDPVSSAPFTPLTLNNHFLTQAFWGEVVGFSVLQSSINTAKNVQGFCAIIKCFYELPDNLKILN
jgi:hypothetical protein